MKHLNMEFLILEFTISLLLSDRKILTDSDFKQRFPPQVIYYGKGHQKFASNVTLYPCKRSRQNHLDWPSAKKYQNMVENYVLNTIDNDLNRGL